MEERRERKKRQTREALVRAALELFDAKGYEHTAVREITDAVDVSERTFFRYFDNKEHVVLSFLKDATDSFVREVAARPADRARPVVPGLDPGGRRAPGRGVVLPARDQAHRRHAVAAVRADARHAR